jgi:hypothetical protein
MGRKETNFGGWMGIGGRIPLAPASSAFGTFSIRRREAE